MRAMVLAAGLGTRLRPLTDSKPKALIEVGGVPMLERVLRRLAAAGVRQAVVNLHHLPELIEEFVASRDFGLTVAFSREEVLLDTGGGLKQAAWFFDDGKPFFLHNVDVESDVDLKAMRAEHETQGALATLAVSGRSSKRRLEFSPSGHLLGRAREISELGLAFGGIHVISPELLPMLSEQGAFSIIDSYVRLAAAGQPIRSFPIDGCFWADVGSPGGLEDARRRASGTP